MHWTINPLIRIPERIGGALPIEIDRIRERRQKVENFTYEGWKSDSDQGVNWTIWTIGLEELLESNKKTQILDL
ncbi:1956_t:CDS:2 [Ambispora gerdemannii]|uniref:1956_t:CDS:1 n=1 Tax=Ambispora gerdemannii TaxID=144530 RepID=A0A9N8Z8P0_9GLOM|nr:1956_t:CDS:2 [Ambispora gerdemannii]